MYLVSETCWLGPLQLAVSRQGIVALSLASEEDFRNTLRRRLPREVLVPAEATHQRLAARIVRHLERSDALLDAELDLRGTPFQRRVWRELQAIPSGQVRTYAQIACRLSQPTAARAVANACGANPVAILVPCHRVLGSDGKLRGYRWGEDKKRALLEHEARLARAS